MIVPENEQLVLLMLKEGAKYVVAKKTHDYYNSHKPSHTYGKYVVVCEYEEYVDEGNYHHIAFYTTDGLCVINLEPIKPDGTTLTYDDYIKMKAALED